MGTGKLLENPDKINCGEVTCNGLASRPGEVEILPAASCYRNWDKHCYEPVLALRLHNRLKNPYWREAHQLALYKLIEKLN